MHRTLDLISAPDATGRGCLAAWQYRSSQVITPVTARGLSAADLPGFDADGMTTHTASRDDAPALAEPGCPYCGEHWGDLGAADWAPPHRRRHWRRVLRRMRRLLAIVIALGVLGVVMSAGLLLITPSVGDAPALARALAHAHRAPYPGPPVPTQFTASLVAAENHRFYSESGSTRSQSSGWSPAASPASLTRAVPPCISS